MIETEAPRELAIDKSNHEFYERLKKGKELPELKNYEMAYLFAIAMAYGVYYNKRKPIQKGHIQRSIVRSVIDKQFGWLIKSIAISISDEGVEVIADRTKIYQIAEEYANGGIELIEEEIKNSKPGEFEINMESELHKIIFESIKEDLGKNKKTDTLDAFESELDSRVNSFEKELRLFIDKTIKKHEPDYWNTLNVEWKKTINGRIEHEIMKNPSKDIQDINPLDHFQIMEYCKLIKEKWSIFKPYFKSRTESHKHFTNISELRNCLKHLKELDEVTYKMGDASIIWVENIIKKYREI
jgi:hypothetical protein